MPSDMVTKPIPDILGESFLPEYVGRSWDDIELGDRLCDYPHNVITLTDEDGGQFASLTGDYNPLHMDEGFARWTSFRKRIVHGAYLFSLAIGQYHKSAYTYGNTIAFVSADTEFLKAAYFGDQVYFTVEVIDKEREPHPKRGLVTYEAVLHRVTPDGNADENDEDILLKTTLVVLIQRISGRAARRRLGLDGKRAKRAESPVVVTGRAQPASSRTCGSPHES
ncbi:MAG: hypothetical protein D8M59_06965 [Planctomycetes bacterium]|nr:hypothetical protein [Planctomycetota bacterium]NOG54355.1 hypothetical protein [Planctomycetota bacterium]